MTGHEQAEGNVQIVSGGNGKASVPPSSDGGLDDPRVHQAMEEYLKLLQAGERPDRTAFLSRYPDLGAPLAACLQGLDFVHAAGPELSHPSTRGAPGSGDTVAPADSIGDFRIVREVGRGGMGVVYEAEQISLGRRVALKVLPFAATMDSRQLQRFKNEAQAAAQLHHTNIVPVYYVGCERSVHFYAMQFIEGHTLADVIGELRGQADGTATKAQPSPRPHTDETVDASAGQPIDAPSAIPGVSETKPVAGFSTERSTKDPAFFRTAAELGVQAAEALDYAHQHGIVHRDIKPANLLVETSPLAPPDRDVGGQGLRLWITDFGLAQVQTDTRLTMTGDLVGTLRYMSPEQTLAKRVVVDHRTDIYSLGATWYELLTLEPVFGGNDRQELLRQIAFEEPRPLRRLNKNVPAELATIVLKCIEKNPADRYATAQEFADDLRHWLQDRPIRARRPNLVQRLRKWSRRHKPLVTAAGVTVLLTALGLLIGGIYHTAKLDAALQETQAEKREALTNLYHARVEEAAALRQARGVGYRTKVWERLRQALAIETADIDKDRLRHEAVACLGDFVGLDPITWTDFPATATDCELSQDGSQIVFGLSDGSIMLRTVATGEFTLRAAAHAGGVRVTFANDGRRIISFGGDDDLKTWEVDQAGRWTCLRTEKPSATQTAALDGWVLYGTTADRGHFFKVRGDRPGLEDRSDLAVWSFVGGSLTASLNVSQALGIKEGQVYIVPKVAISPDGKLLAVATRSRSHDYATLVWDIPGRRVRQLIPSPLGAVAQIAFSPDGERLACSCDNGLLILETKDFRQWSILRHNSVTALSFSPDGQFLAFATFSPAVKIWSMTTNREVAILNHPEAHGALELHWSGDGRVLVGSADRSVRIWNVGGTLERQILAGHLGGVPAVAFSPDGKLLASGSKDKIAKIWEASTGRLLRALPEQEGFIQTVAFSADGGLLATGDWSGAVKVWDVATFREKIALNPGLGEIDQVAFSPDGRHFAACGSKGLGLWRIRGNDSGRDQAASISLELVTTLPATSSLCLCFSPDSKLLAWLTNRRMVRVWDVEKQCELPFPGNPLLDGWNNLAFYPDSKHLAFVSYQRNLEVWNVPESQQTLTIGRPGEFGAQVIALSADGHWLATNPNESAITLWDAGTGERLVTFPEERAPIWSLAWSPDRRRLAVGLSDGGLVTWDLPRVRAELAALGLNWGEDSAPGSNPLQSSNPRESSGSGSAPALNEREIVLRFYTLGNAYLNSGQFDAAIVQFRSALSRDPSFAAARNNLGRALKSQGKLDEALQEFELTKQQLPKDPNIRYNIAFTLEDKGLYEEALAVLEETEREIPRVVQTQHNIADVYRRMNRPDKVIEAYEKAIEVNPSFPYAYMQLGQIFRQQGRFVEALEKMKKGLALKSKDQQPNFASDAWIKECEHLAELDAKLPEILSGKAAPANNFERLELARMCALYKKLNVAAVRLFSQAFSEQPQLADNLNTQDRYNAACAAALAGCGQGKDKDLTGDQERARLRGQALEWLRADLSAWRQLLDKERDKVRPVVLKTMLHWQQDTDFAVVRGMPALAKLPEAQRLEWQKLWADVADTLTRAQGDAAAEKKSDTK